MPYAAAIAIISAAEFTEDLNAVQATKMACRRLMLRREGLLHAAAQGATLHVSNLTDQQRTKLQNAAEADRSRGEFSTASGKRTDAENWAKTTVDGMILSGHGGDIPAAAYTRSNRVWHRPSSTAASGR